MAKRPNWKTVDVSTLQKIEDLCGHWSYIYPYHKWETYLLRTTDRENTLTTTYLRVSWDKQSAGAPWLPSTSPSTHRCLYRRVLKKYLSINGPMEGKKIVPNEGYCLYSAPWRTAGGLPRKVLIHTEILGKRLGLVW